MDIDLSPLYSKVIDKIELENTYSIPKEYYENSDVIELKPVTIKGKVYQEEDDNIHILCSIEGTMVIKDSISLEKIDYPFQIEYDDVLEENCKKCEKVLDIFQFLWENIVLEVPLQFTKVEDLSKYHGDGWKLISEDEHHSQNNPFSELLKDYDKE